MNPGITDCHLCARTDLKRYGYCSVCGRDLGWPTYPSLTPEDFRNRIRNLCTGRPIDAINGASHADPCLVRKPTDPKYQPPTRKDTK